jgi:hypothetical protein
VEAHANGHGGVTLCEFVAICARNHYPGVKEVSIEASRTFLDRCCEIGFLERRTCAKTGTRYYPTDSLYEWVWMVGDGNE